MIAKLEAVQPAKNVKQIATKLLNVRKSKSLCMKAQKSATARRIKQEQALLAIWQNIQNEMVFLLLQYSSIVHLTYFSIFILTFSSR